MTEIKLISFDFDMTLTKNCSAMEHFAQQHDFVEQVKKLDQEFMAGLINTHQFADICAKYFTNLSFADIDKMMAGLVLIDDCQQVIDEIRGRGIKVIISSVGYRALIRPIAQRLGIDVFSGADLAQNNQIYNGEMSRYFSEYHKITFVQKYAIEHDIDLQQVMAVGDSGTDVPLFNVVGKAIAFNANETAREHAHHQVVNASLAPILQFL